jgi:RNA polymerase sigma factor (sigma-70 family)
MSLAGVRDEFLAGRASRGDGAAFAELARRYRPLIVSASKYPEAGLEFEDLRQEALIGLFVACRKCNPAKGGRFAGLARVCVRWAVGQARKSSRARKHLILTHALADHDEISRRLEQRVGAPASDPAVVVELRDELRAHARRLRRRIEAPAGDLRRRYSDEQIERALALVAAGQTFQVAALAVGTRADTVARWVQRAGTPRPGTRRRFSQAEIAQVLSLVHAGVSARKAGQAVGANDATVYRWLQDAA